MIKSYAKINLFLEIIGRQNNFHILHSLFLKIDLYDEIVVKKSLKLKTTYNGTTIQNDIVLKTQKVLRNYFPKINTNFEFEVVKKIPIGGGLGGASSNAAEVLKFLLKENQIELPLKSLFEIGSEIGADVPFFLCEEPMLLNGVGKELTKPSFEIPRLWFVLGFTNYSAITKEIFAKITPPYDNFTHVKSFEDCLQRKNAMQNVTNELSGDLILQTLEKLNDKNALCVKMSGSGSTCFAVFESEEKIPQRLKSNEFQICTNI